MQALFISSKPVLIDGLTPGTVYTDYQVRAFSVRAGRLGSPSRVMAM